MKQESKREICAQLGNFKRRWPYDWVIYFTYPIAALDPNPRVIDK